MILPVSGAVTEMYKKAGINKDMAGISIVCYDIYEGGTGYE